MIDFILVLVSSMQKNFEKMYFNDKYSANTNQHLVVEQPELGLRIVRVRASKAHFTGLFYWLIFKKNTSSSQRERIFRIMI